MGCNRRKRHFSRSVIGAILVNSLKSMVSESFPAVWSYFIGISFIAVVIFMPYGLAGLLNQIKGKIYAQKSSKKCKKVFFCHFKYS